MKILAFFLIFYLALSQPAYSKEIIGYAKVVDADTIHISNHRIRLEGIDAPEIKQKCIKNEKYYFCGAISKNKLKEKINNKIVRCKYSSKDRYNRYLSICFVKNINLNKWLVKNGYAIAYKKYSKKYVFEEKYAKANKLGIWSGSFVNPEKWRKQN